jgi:hypothetical protein
LLGQVIERLGKRATLHLIEGGDHSFKVQKRSGRTEADVLGELVGALDEWARASAPPSEAHRAIGGEQPLPKTPLPPAR